MDDKTRELVADAIDCSQKDARIAAALLGLPAGAGREVEQARFDGWVEGMKQAAGIVRRWSPEWPWGGAR